MNLWADPNLDPWWSEEAAFGRLAPLFHPAALVACKREEDVGFVIEEGGGVGESV